MGSNITNFFSPRKREITYDPSLNTKSCIRRPLCSTFENLRGTNLSISPKKIVFYVFGIKKKRKNYNFTLCNFLVRTLQCFSFFKYFFCPWKHEKNHPQKLLRKTQILFFFLTASTAQMAKIEEFTFQNVAYRPTVYRTGIKHFQTCSNSDSKDWKNCKIWGRKMFYTSFW